MTSRFVGHSLVFVLAAANGRVSWTWMVGTNTTPGSWPIDIRCSQTGASGKLTLKIKVTT